MPTYQPQDRFFRQARAEGLPSRAAFKLRELLARFALITPAARVVDLGCAPGGWLAVLAPMLGARGKLVGIDSVPCRAPAPGVRMVVGDATTPAVRQQVLELLEGQADLITSDMAAKLTGIAARDQAQAARLLAAARDCAAALLKPGGALVAKAFMGEEFEATRAEIARAFQKIDIVHTKASRPGSKELYLVARGLVRPAAG